MDHQTLIETTLKFWAVQDVEQTLGMLSDDVVYQIYNVATAAPFAGATRGKDALRTRLYDILAAFDYLHYEPILLDVRDGVARVQTCFVLRHRASREQLSGSKRFVCTINDGAIARIDEYHDAALFSAFMGLTRSRPAAAPVPRPIAFVN